MLQQVLAGDDDALESVLPRLLGRVESESSPYRAERLAILHLLQGQIFFRRKRYHDAVAAYNQMESILPVGRGVLREKLATSLGDIASALTWPHLREPSYTKEAEQFCIKILDWYPERHAIRNLLGTILFSGGRVAEALAAFRAAIALDENASYQVNEAVCLENMQRYEEAFDTLTRAAALAPNSAEPLFFLGRLNRRLKRHEDARNCLLKATELDPSFVIAFEMLGQVNFYLKNYDDARWAFRQALQLDPRHIGALNGLGSVALEEERYDEARERFTEVSRLYPRLATPHHGLGWVAYEEQRFDEARNCFQRACELDPDLAGPYNGLGWVAYEQQDYDTAKDFFAKAMRLNPRLASPQHGLAWLAFAHGHRDEAKRLYALVMELEPRYPDPADAEINSDDLSALLRTVLPWPTRHRVSGTKGLVTR